MQQKSSKIAYLTIDDSPSEDFESKLAYLKSKKIPAVFFCIGKLLEAYPDEAIKSIQSGYPIENHSYSHPHFSEISLADCQTEIEKTDMIIEQLYKQASVERKQKLFRFPYGDKGDGRGGKLSKTTNRYNKERHHAIQNMLKDLAYTQPQYEGMNYRFMDKAGFFDDIDMSWTFDIMEWTIVQKKPKFNLIGIDSILKRLEEKNPRDCRGRIWFEKTWLSTSSSEIILLHDHSGSNQVFEKIIDKLATLPLKFSKVW